MKMSQLMLDIQAAIQQGAEPAQIAMDFEIPVSWVFESQALATEYCGNFATSAVDH
jgi:hypothetical protein